MESYRISIKSSVARELEALPALKDRHRAMAIISGLSSNPRPEGSRKLADAADVFRSRFGSNRILYTVNDHVRVVAVFEIARRGEAHHFLAERGPTTGAPDPVSPLLIRNGRVPPHPSQTRKPRRSRHD